MLSAKLVGTVAITSVLALARSVVAVASASFKPRVAVSISAVVPFASCFANSATACPKAEVLSFAWSARLAGIDTALAFLTAVSRAACASLITFCKFVIALLRSAVVGFVGLSFACVNKVCNSSCASLTACSL